MDLTLKTICELCVEVTNRLLIHSNTRDETTPVMTPEQQLHHAKAILVMRDMRVEKIYTILDHILKFSIGNCGEFSILCGFLLKSLLSISPPNARIFKISCGYLSPGDHAFCILEEIRAGVSTLYIVDSWLNIILPLDNYVHHIRHNSGHSRFFRANSRIARWFVWSNDKRDTCIPLIFKYDIAQTFDHMLNIRNQLLAEIRSTILDPVFEKSLL